MRQPLLPLMERSASLFPHRRQLLVTRLRQHPRQQEAAEQRDDGTGDDHFGRTEHGLEPPLGGPRSDRGLEDGPYVDRPRITGDAQALVFELTLEGSHVIHR